MYGESGGSESSSAILEASGAAEGPGAGPDGSISVVGVLIAAGWAFAGVTGFAADSQYFFATKPPCGAHTVDL